jgi:hypothetical protein
MLLNIFCVHETEEEHKLRMAFENKVMRVFERKKKETKFRCTTFKDEEFNKLQVSFHC